MRNLAIRISEKWRSSSKMKCWYNCGTDIIFDDGVRGKTGKKIPLNLDGTRHDCPNSSYNKRFPPQKSIGSAPIVTTAGELTDDMEAM